MQNIDSLAGQTLMMAQYISNETVLITSAELYIATMVAIARNASITKHSCTWTKLQYKYILLY